MSLAASKLHTTLSLKCIIINYLFLLLKKVDRCDVHAESAFWCIKYSAYTQEQTLYYYRQTKMIIITEISPQPSRLLIDNRVRVLIICGTAKVNNVRRVTMNAVLCPVSTGSVCCGFVVDS